MKINKTNVSIPKLETLPPIPERLSEEEKHRRQEMGLKFFEPGRLYRSRIPRDVSWSCFDRPSWRDPRPTIGTKIYVSLNDIVMFIKFDPETELVLFLHKQKIICARNYTGVATMFDPI